MLKKLGAGYNLSFHRAKLAILVENSKFFESFLTIVRVFESTLTIRLLHGYGSCLSVSDFSNSKSVLMKRGLLFYGLQMPHFMSAPCCVINKFKAQTAIETFRSGIAFVYEQSYGLFLPLLVDELF